MDPGLSSDCKLLESTKWSLKCMLTQFLHNFHIGPFHYVCLCVCAYLYMSLYVSLCVCICVCVASVCPWGLQHVCGTLNGVYAAFFPSP